MEDYCYLKKTKSYLYAKGSVVTVIILLCLLKASADESHYLFLDNLKQKSENEIEFDVFLQNIGQSFYLNDYQVEILFNAKILPKDAFFDAPFLKVISESSDLLTPPASENFTISNDGERLILISNKPGFGTELQKIATDEKVRLAKLRAIVLYENKRGAFVNKKPMLNLDQYASKIQKASVNEAGLKTSFGEIMNNKILGSEICDYPLSNFVFTGNGYWHASQGDHFVHWNNHPDTHILFANKLPDMHADILISGQAIIGAGETVSITPADNTGGSLTINIPESGKHMLMLTSNCQNTSLLLFDENFETLENPAHLSSESVVFFGAYNSTCGEFVRWKDQYGTIISEFHEAGPYVMPAEDMIITAKWEFGDSKKKEGLNWLKLSLKDVNNPALIVSPYASLTVDRLVNAHPAGDGAILLKSESPHDIPGSFIHAEDQVALTAERFIGRHEGGHPVNQWHMIASPVTDMPIRPEFVPEGIIPPWVDFYKWDESHIASSNGEMITGWWINSKQAGGTWNDAFEQTFQNGKGYLLAYAQPDKSYGDRAHRFQGNTQAQDVAINGLTHSPEGTYAGWHLLGNPFASALDWSLGDWQRQHIQGGPQIWDAQWSSYAPVIHIIPAMTAFMVNTTGNGSLVIPAEARVHQATPEAGSSWAAYPHHEKTSLPESLNSNTPPHVHLRARDIQGHTAQASIILFREEATEHFDPKYDTPFIAGHAPQLWSKPPAHHPDNDESPRLALNNLPEAYHNLQVPFGFIKNEGQQFLFELLHNSTPRTLFLEDLLNNQMHPLCNEKPYLFTAANQDPPDRFILHFTDGTPPDPSAEEDQHLRPHIHASRHTLYVQTYCNTCSISVFNIRGMRFIHKALRKAGTHHISHQLPHGIYVARFHCQETSGAVKVLVP